MKVKSSSKKNKVTLKKKYGGGNANAKAKAEALVLFQLPQKSEHTTDIIVKRKDDDKFQNLLEFQFRTGDAIESNDINDLCLENGQFKLIKKTQPENKYVLVFKIKDSNYFFQLNSNFVEDEIYFPFNLKELKLQNLEVFLKANESEYGDKGGLEHAFKTDVKELVFVVPTQTELEQAIKESNDVIESESNSENQKIKAYKLALKNLFGKAANGLGEANNLIEANTGGQAYINAPIF